MARMVGQKMQFSCTLCGKFFGRDIMGLARHIGSEHDPDRTAKLQ